MTSRAGEPLLSLIDAVYGAALDASQWEALAPRVAAVFDSTSTTILTLGGENPPIYTMTDNVRAGFRAYQEYYCKKDPWIEGGKKLGFSRAGCSSDMISDRDFANTEFFRDWCRHLDVFYVVGSVFKTAADEIGVLGIHRPRAAGAYQDSDTSAVATFLPHLQRALQVRHQLSRTALLERVSFEILNRAHVAAIVTCADGKVLFANSQAEALLTEGGALRLKNGRVSAMADADRVHLSELLRTASDLGQDSASAGGLMSIRHAHRLPLIALVAPCRLHWPGMPEPSALLLIRDPNQRLHIATALHELFSLTPAEARIAESLASGRTLEEIARAQGATAQTVRKQLKAIFAKTGTHRQAQCVSMLLRSIAPLMQGRDAGADQAH